VERFRLLYETYADRVLAYALRRTRSDEAEEVVADTFMVAWRRLNSVPEDPVPWLLAVARRVLANRIRAAGRRASLGSRLQDSAKALPQFAPDPAEEIGARLSLREAFGRLSEWDQEALMLIAWDRLDNRRAAAAMGCSQAAFAVRLHRARERLDRALERGHHDANPNTRTGPMVEEAE
jgi:RNA polymerase sigma-70 factor, ECF subfamily